MYKPQKKVHAVFVSRGASLKSFYNQDFERYDQTQNIKGAIIPKIVMLGSAPSAEPNLHTISCGFFYVVDDFLV